MFSAAKQLHSLRIAYINASHRLRRSRPTVLYERYKRSQKGNEGRQRYRESCRQQRQGNAAEAMINRRDTPEEEHALQSATHAASCKTTSAQLQFAYQRRRKISFSTRLLACSVPTCEMADAAVLYAQAGGAARVPRYAFYGLNAVCQCRSVRQVGVMPNEKVLRNGNGTRRAFWG